MVEVIPHTVVKLGESKYCIVLLKERSGPRLLPIWMRVHRAQPIVLWMKSIRLARPRTHDLFIEVAEKLGGQLLRATMYAVEKGTLLSRVILLKGDGEIALQCEASDAIAVAITKDIPIVVADEIMRVAGFAPRQSNVGASTAESEEEEKLAAFRDFIEGLDLSGF